MKPPIAKQTTENETADDNMESRLPLKYVAEAI